MSDALKALERLIDQASNTAEDGFKVFEDAELVRSALHQQEQAEPVGYIDEADDGGAYVELYDGHTFTIGDPVYRHPPSAVPRKADINKLIEASRCLGAAQKNFDVDAILYWEDRVGQLHKNLSAAPQPKETGE